jgi:hypothetical protein
MLSASSGKQIMRLTKLPDGRIEIMCHHVEDNKDQLIGIVKTLNVKPFMQSIREILPNVTFEFGSR